MQRHLRPFSACLFLTLLPLAITTARAADLRLPTMFADHMVLQRESAAAVWGWTAANAAVSVKGSWGATAEAKSDEHGAWNAKLKTPAAGGPFTLTISSGKDKIEVQDVLSGEVWLASGQSNMEFTVGPKYFGVREFDQVRAAAKHPEIRFFDVPNVVSATPKTECGGKWLVCSPDTVGEFSAAAYFFALELQEKLHVPIGVLESDWGGTPAEAWTSTEVISKFDVYKPGVEDVKKLSADPATAKKTFEAAYAAWKDKLENADDGAKAGYMKPDYDDHEWGVMQVPGSWSGDLEQFDGVVWQRIGVDIPAVWENRTLVMSLGPIDDFDTTWFNGVKVGETFGAEVHTKARTYEIPPNLVKAGRAVIAVRVVDIMGPGGFFGKPEDIKIHPRDDFEGVMLSDRWRFKRGIDISVTGRPPQPAALGPWHPASLFNGMIAPLIPYTLRGAIWYQGESNRNHADVYAKLFGAMIGDWRQRWGSGDFPFYFVQIAPFRYGDLLGKAAYIREAQRRTLYAVPNTGMAVTTDVSNLADIHPKDKQAVGKRLALWALANTYGSKNIEFSGPLYKGMKVEGGKVRVQFDHCSGLTSHNGKLETFEVAGSDGKFVPANATIDGDTVVVSAEGVANPTAVRYGYTDTDEAHLWNAAGLPASPFTSQGR